MARIVHDRSLIAQVRKQVGVVTDRVALDKARSHEARLGPSTEPADMLDKPPVLRYHTALEAGRPADALRVSVMMMGPGAPWSERPDWRSRTQEAYVACARESLNQPPGPGRIVPEVLGEGQEAFVGRFQFAGARIGADRRPVGTETLYAPCVRMADGQVGIIGSLAPDQDRVSDLVRLSNGAEKSTPVEVLEPDLSTVWPIAGPPKRAKVTLTAAGLVGACASAAEVAERAGLKVGGRLELNAATVAGEIRRSAQAHRDRGTLEVA